MPRRSGKTLYGRTLSERPKKTVIAVAGVAFAVGVKIELFRIGDRRAVKPLIEAGAGVVDVFLKHAIIYALFEIGESESLPADHPLAKQVLLMHEVDRRNAPPHAMPEIQLADEVDPDPEKLSLVATNQVGDRLHTNASLAFADGRIFLRTDTALFAIGP